MDIEKLIETLRQHGVSCVRAYGKYCSICDEAATALSTIQAENAEMQKQLNEFSEFLCRMTGGLLSKTNYTAQEMATAAEDYQQKVCGECDLQAENEKLRADLNDLKAQWDMYGGDEGITATFAELERVKQERDAAVKDLNEFLAMDELCPIQCEWCKWKDTFCDGKTPEWRGIKED